jgi:hypothetical protein
MTAPTAPDRHPTLASSCARAATAAEARFRIDYPDRSHRDSRVIALDQRTAGLARRLAAEQHWRGGHFLILDQVVPAGDDTVLQTTSGAEVLLSEELADADVVVMLAGPTDGPTDGTAASSEAAAVIGDACAARFIMSAGLVVPGGGPGGSPGGGPGGGSTDEVVSALRPNAMVLVILQESDDVAEVLSALRV